MLFYCCFSILIPVDLRFPPRWQVVGFISELVRFVIGTVIIVYHGAVEAVVARLPPVPGLVWTVRFVFDTTVG